MNQSDRPMDSSLRGSGRGKLILFGEHAAVYGYPAVGTSLPCKTTLSPELPGTGLQDTSRESEESESDRKLIRELIHRAAELASVESPVSPDELKIISDVPRTGGFGSSAALCVAVARTVLNSFNPGYSRKVHILANRLEERFHGTPSGIDTGMASDTGTAAWIKNKDMLPVREALTLPRWHIIYAALPRKAPTGDSVAALRRLKESGDPGVNGAMEALGRISGKFIRMVKDAQRNESDFAQSAALLAAEAQNLLGSLGLSTVELDEILNLAGELGASGGKLSGGGMGGAFYICTGERELRDSLLRLLPGRIKARGIRLTVPLSPLDFGRKESG